MGQFNQPGRKMQQAPHAKILSIGFASFALIFGLTFLLLMLTSLGVFVALGFTMADETGDSMHAGIGILGGLFAIVFYCVLAVIFVIPTGLAGWKLFKGRRHARLWGTIAAILILPVLPIGTVLGVYGLWFFFSANGKQLSGNG